MFGGVKEVMFLTQLFTNMKVSGKLPVTIKVDNYGMILMADNVTVTRHMKHEDIMYKNVKKYVQDGMIKIMFIK